MQLKHSDAHTLEFVDRAAMPFMALVVHRLNQVLQEQGIEGSDRRQAICVDFLFGFAYQLDAGWFVEGNQRLFPIVCFAERADATEQENLGRVSTLHVPTDASSWHEYAHGVVSQYFDEQDEALPDVRTGSNDLED